MQNDVAEMTRAMDEGNAAVGHAETNHAGGRPGLKRGWSRADRNKLHAARELKGTYHRAEGAWAEELWECGAG